MGLVTTLLTLPVAGPLQAAWWLAEKIHDQALQAMNDPAEIKRCILRLEAMLEAGEIDEETYETAELALLTRLRDVQRAGGARAAAQAR
ncbi:MAG: gas vesicle protein GvpG [Pseudomonadota bacterium]